MTWFKGYFIKYILFKFSYVKLDIYSLFFFVGLRVFLQAFFYAFSDITYYFL